MIKNILNLGDAAVYCDFGKDVNQEINTNVIKYFKNIKDKNIEGIKILCNFNEPSIGQMIRFDASKMNVKKIKLLPRRENCPACN